MSSVLLLALDGAAAQRLAQAPEVFAQEHSLEIEPHGALVREVARQTAVFLEGIGATAPWTSYLALDAGRRLVGTCSFKGTPDAKGAVEIAYYTFPGGEGRGIATAMGRALLDIAAAEPDVRRVCALTLAGPGASGRVLEKLGFRWVGEVIDSEDGRVWRWERAPQAGASMGR